MDIDWQGYTVTVIGVNLVRIENAITSMDAMKTTIKFIQGTQRKYKGNGFPETSLEFET